MGLHVLLPLLICSVVSARVYKRCELARELLEVHEIPKAQLATWVCIANYESHYNTSAHNSRSGDHGLFQISELYWCSPPGEGLACGVSCAELKDDDIEDDVVCARRIFRQHQRLTGDGFNAWAVYKRHCNDKEHVRSFLRGCSETNGPKAGAKNANNLDPDEATQGDVSIKLLILSEKPRAVSRQKKAKSFRKSTSLDEMEADRIPISTVSKHTNFKPTIHLLS
ncbi:hypothetical protein PPYR_14579 [Photinus pyralis]|uniref:lysozyme n=2 Tax=Photinus pyralis TaxID=7054 RepID=A0A5N4A5M0_PHOPY|nr:lysozyme C-1-like [Photinus pyralis]KAB0792620.1 hypothetical protein PPYR_14579 [Photinus pyralis]